MFRYVWNTQSMDDDRWWTYSWLTIFTWTWYAWCILTRLVNAFSSHFGVELELIQLSRDIHQRRCGILHVFGIGTSAIADWTLPSASWSDRPDILQLHVWHTLKINQTWDLRLWTLLLAFSGYISKQNCGWEPKLPGETPDGEPGEHTQCIGYRNISFEIKWLWHTTGWNSSLKNLQLLVYNFTRSILTRQRDALSGSIRCKGFHPHLRTIKSESVKTYIHLWGDKDP